MLMILLTFLLLNVSFTIFSIGIQLQSINRIVFQTPKGLVERCVPMQYEDGFVPHFDKELLISKLTSYYQEVLDRYTKNVSVDYYFYNVSDGSYCLNDECDGVKVTINSIVSFSFVYHRTVFFEIREGNVYGN